MSMSAGDVVNVTLGVYILGVLIYSDLEQYDLRCEIKHFEVIGCKLSKRQADASKSNWEKYYRYWKCRSNNPGSIRTALRGTVWLINQAMMELRDRKSVV